MSVAHGDSFPGPRIVITLTLCMGKIYDRPTLKHLYKRNTLDCDQSNCSSRIVFSHIPIQIGQTGITAIRSADLENPTVEPNMKWIARPRAEIWPFEIFPHL